MNIEGVQGIWKVKDGKKTSSNREIYSKPFPLNFNKFIYFLNIIFFWVVRLFTYNPWPHNMPKHTRCANTSCIMLHMAINNVVFIIYVRCSYVYDCRNLIFFLWLLLMFFFIVLPLNGWFCCWFFCLKYNKLEKRFLSEFSSLYPTHSKQHRKKWQNFISLLTNGNPKLSKQGKNEKVLLSLATICARHITMSKSTFRLNEMYCVLLFCLLLWCMVTPHSAHIAVNHLKAIAALAECEAPKNYLRSILVVCVLSCDGHAIFLLAYTLTFVDFYSFVTVMIQNL